FTLLMKTKLNPFEVTSKKNTLHLAYWTGSWVLTVAIASFGPKLIWDNDITISLLFIVINIIIGVGMILMNRKFMNGLDEMQRKVCLDAMAIAIGVGLVGGISYSMLDQVNVIAFPAEIAHLLILMGITYIIAIVVGNYRYK
ncbi:MAG TPA: hypothetical protein VFM72_05450, partial [Aequorivita sp.]|nr:hypothetical protein [Aequorivita sp.]